ncbi:MAG TPA: hypothetical protein ENK77_00350 [Epsilonproteobacteria bacterium]|nr:hypothetical protein [Campylobacterota bacterium]
MQKYELDYIGFSNEDGDGCMAVFVDFPDIKGVGDTFDEARIDAYEALEEYMKSKEKRVTTEFEKGVDAYSDKLYPQAYRHFETAASKNSNPDAMTNLAILHMRGFGCERDLGRAKEWFQKAVDMGQTQAMMSLAHIYEKGLDGAPDEEMAAQYYKMAADNGDVNAQVKSGIYFRQKGLNAKAMQYLITAAHNNNAQAQEIITYVSNQGAESLRNEMFRSLDEHKQRELVEKMLEKEIRPALAADNGGIELVNYIGGEVPQIWLNYLGACSGCHLGSTSTADMLLKHFETLIDKNVVLYLM